MESSNSFLSVIKNRGFINLWANQILVQLAYNALNFALIIWVFQLTGSSTANSALLFAIYLPAVLFGAFSGVLVDVLDRRRIILVINIGLAVLFFSLIFLKWYYPAILAIAFLINTLSQFYSPAESSAIPLIVKKHQLLVANALFAITLQTSFLLGFGLAGPLIDLLSINSLFLLGTALLLTAFLLAFRFPSIINKSDSEGKKLTHALAKRDFKQVFEVGSFEVKETVSLIRGKLPVMSAILILSGIQIIIGILAVIISPFFERVLQIHATGASYVLILPLGAGMVTGGLMLSRVGGRFPKRWIVSRGITIVGLLFLLVGLAPIISPVIHYFPKPTPLPFIYQPSLSTILAFGAFLLGMAMVAIMVPAQTVLQENTPEQDRGKVFAVLNAVMMGLSLIPVLLAGVLADLFGTLPLFLGMGGVIFLLGLFALKPDFFFEEKHLPFKFREFMGLGHWQKVE